MMKRGNTLIFLFLVSGLTLDAQYPPAAGENGSDAVHCDSSAIKEWATGCRILRGPVQIDKPELGLASSGHDTLCRGKADNMTVSLGDGGEAVVTFQNPVSDIPGFDFAVFENSFDGRFLELAFVEVSTDSLDWVRFPSVSLTPYDFQTGTFGNLEPERISNLAGKYRALCGTPFDLDDLRDSAGIDINKIRYIRITDAVGCIGDKYSRYDSRYNRINDPWPTPFPQSGFDLDAVAVLRSVKNETAKVPHRGVSVFPNPAAEKVFVRLPESDHVKISLLSLNGICVAEKTGENGLNEIDITGLKPGIYLLCVTQPSRRSYYRLIVK